MHCSMRLGQQCGRCTDTMVNDGVSAIYGLCVGTYDPGHVVKAASELCFAHSIAHLMASSFASGV